MPLPAARFTLSYVGGGARAQRSGAAARAEAQVGGVLRWCELARFVRALCSVSNGETFEAFLRHLLRHRSRGKHLVVVPDNASCHHAVSLAPLMRQLPKRLVAVVPATVQSATRTHRTRLEAHRTARHPQPVPRDPRRGTRCRECLLPAVATAQLGAAKTMLHCLSRYVSWQQRGRFNRIIGKAWVAPLESPCRGKPDCPMTLDAGPAQITTGRAWWFRRHANEHSPEDRGRYESGAQEARGRKVGLWRDGAAVPPWEWRSLRSIAGK